MADRKEAAAERQYREAMAAARNLPPAERAAAEHAAREARARLLQQYLDSRRRLGKEIT